MRVLLINPPYLAKERYGKDLAHFGPCTEPLGLAYIAAALEREGHEVKILDGQIKWTIDGIMNYLYYNEDMNPLTSSKFTKYSCGFDIIGITCLTPSYNIVKKLCQKIKKAWDIPIVVGGAHPTAMPEETLKDIPEIDYIVRGEGELTILDLIYYMENKGSFRIQSFTGQPIKNLDDIPMPARHLLPMDQYQITASRNQGHHAYTISVARGCPFKCGFCSRINGRKLRFHSHQRILQEVDCLINEYGAKEINFEADTITVNKSWLMELCDSLINLNYHNRISWTCESRVDTVDREMLEMMKKAGCWQISYGVETGNQRLLDFIKKGTTLEQIRNTFDITKQVGINIRAFYMLGIPTETRKESLNTIEFAKKLNADWSQFTLFTPFPGTELYDIAQKEGGLSTNWADYKTHGGWEGGKLAYVPQGRTEIEMKELQVTAYWNYYMRPRVIYAFVKKMYSWAKVREYMKGFIVLLKTRFA